MQEEAVPMSEEDASDTEVIMVSSQGQTLPKDAQHHHIVNHQLRSQEGILDNQLKALGLYEEGLSIDQKEELLAVVAASRETAEQEESMRMRAKEWQQKVFPDDVEFDATPPFQDQNDPSASPSRVEGSLQLLNIEDDSPSACAPQELFEVTEIDEMTPKESEEPGSEIQTIEHSEETGELQSKRVPTRRGRGRRGGRGRGQSAAPKVMPSLPVTVLSDATEQEVDVSDDLQVSEADQRKLKKRSEEERRDLERFMSEWTPGSSPKEEQSLVDRHLQKDSDVSPVEDEIHQTFLDCIEGYHAALNRLQQSSDIYLPWGQPITVGRAYATRSARNRAPDSDNSDGLHTFQPGGMSDEMFHSEESLSDKYSQLQQYDKLFYPSPNTNGVNTAKTLGSATHTSRASKGSSCPKRTRYLEEATRGDDVSIDDDDDDDDQKENAAMNTAQCSGNKVNSESPFRTSVPQPGVPVLGDGNKDRMPLPETVGHDTESCATLTAGDSEADVAGLKQGLKTYCNKKQFPSRSALSRNKKNCQQLDTIENSVPVNIDDISPWSAQKLLCEVRKTAEKRKVLSPSLSKVSSPSKRLKEGGTT